MRKAGRESSSTQKEADKQHHPEGEEGSITVKQKAVSRQRSESGTTQRLEGGKQHHAKGGGTNAAPPREGSRQEDERM